MTATAPFAGTERFEIRGRLGSGGMGVVFAAFDREREVDVALKTLHRTDDPEALLRFKREFRSLADVSHPNLVRLYELIAEGEQWFFTMELLDAIDFVSWVRHEDPPAPEIDETETFALTAVTTPALLANAEPTPLASIRGGEVDYHRLRSGLRGLVGGLAALHGSGHLHRDVKPSNILVTPEGRVVVVDFGVITEMSASSTEVIGTPAYMAPEQASGRTERASDWYAVGAVIYEAITGRRPFHGSRSAILEAKAHWDPLRPKLALRDVPGDLDGLCMRLLDREPASRPDAAEILSMLTGRPRRRRQPSFTEDGVVLLGRERELSTLEAAFARVGPDRPSVVDVHGESGMGKTALIRSFLEHVAADGAVVLAGRCYENETVPHKAIDSVIDALADLIADLEEPEQRRLVSDDAAALARMFPVLRQIPAIAELDDVEDTDRVEVRHRARMALRHILARLAERRRVVLFIDDLHWGDLESAPLLDALTRPPGAPPIMLVATSRTESRRRSPLLKALRRRRRRLGPALAITELEVGLLAPDDSAALATRLLGDRASDTAVEQIVEESGGNPYLIGELARYAAGRSPAGAGAPTLDTMIGARIDRLGADDVRVLELLALAGRPLTHATARAAASIARPGWHALIHDMRHRHLVRVSGFADDDSIEPYHDRIRETVARGLDERRRREHHRALAAALESTGTGQPHELARHHAYAGNDEAAVTWAIAGAERATEILAFDQAAALWQLAIDLGGQRAEWLEAQARALVAGGRGRDAAGAFLAAAEVREGLDQIQLQREAAEQLLRSGYIARGLEVLRGVLDEVGVKLPASARGSIPALLWYQLRARLRGLDFRERDAAEIPARELVRVDVCLSAAIGLAQIDVGRAAAFAQRTLVYALAAGEPGRIAYAMAMVAGFTSGAGGAEQAANLLERAREIAGRLGDPHLEAFVKIAGGVDQYERGDFVAYQETATASEQVLRTRCRGVAWELRTMQLLSASALFFLGRLDELAERVPEWLSSATERGDLYATTNIHALAMPIVRIAVDDVEGTRAEHAAAEASWSYPEFTLQRMLLLYTRTVLDLYTGDVASAYARVVAGDPDVRRSLLIHDRSVGNFWRFLRSSAAAAFVAEGGKNPSRLHRRMRRDARQLWCDHAPCYQAMGAALFAAIAHQRGDGDEARRQLELAVDRFDAAGFVIYATCCRFRLGEITGDRELADRSLADLAGVATRPETIARSLVCGF